ncbi:MAG: transcriptional regulator, TetR family [Herbinix sp.]|nr:transcriptional regulator, TetR family [Herbinix sp.]
MTKREEQRNQRKQEILSAGLDLFVRRGYTATKISDIATAVNMSVGLLFHYFPSKEKLYEELIRIGLSGTQSIMLLSMDNPIQFFEQAASNLLEYMKADPFVAKMFVLMSQACLNDAAPQVVKGLVSQINNIKICVPMIEEGQKLGLIREGNPFALSMAFWCSIQGIAEEIAMYPETPYPEAEWIVDIIKKKGD